MINDDHDHKTKKQKKKKRPREYPPRDDHHCYCYRCY